ncbi:hypothetical protein [Tenacibaculum sp. nBUS_03]|uniref:hypothetical protein n=1 Tax=Tenacibaculum sp. nBUS_03 TaxID=3395320 RepID=UPI003EB881D6
MIGIILKYSIYYNKPIPENPLGLLAHLPKNEIIVTISKINTLLQPQGYRNSDNSRETQIECLKAILLQDEKNSPIEYIKKFQDYAYHLSNLPKQYSVFTRGTCLYGLNEILQSDTFLTENKTQYTFDERIGILDYLLVCNERILKFSNEEPLEKFTEQGINFFEFFAFNQIPLNQYNISVNSLTKLHKSAFFLKSLMNDDSIKEHLVNYFKDKYGLDDIEEFFRVFILSFLKMYDENLKIYHLKIDNEQKKIIEIIKGFSINAPLKIINHDDVKTLDFLPVKKSPIFSWEPLSSDEFTGFAVLDMAFLLEKMDSFFINDFWFDYLKTHSDLNRTDWGNFIGSKFFEPLVEDVISNTFNNKQSYTIKMLDELKITLPAKSEIEIADVYIRQKQKIACIEVKSNFINMVDGYKSVTNIEEFKALDLDKFYKSFGLTQMLDTMKNFHKYKHHLKDEGLNFNRKVHLYPIILVNEPILSSGLFNFPLRQQFEKMLIEENINLKSKGHIIWPLVIMNIEEFQELEQSIKDDDIDFFKILDSLHSKTSIKGKIVKDKYKTLLTIHSLINEKIEFDKLFPLRLKDFKWTFAK